MIRFVELLIALLIVVCIFVLVGLFLPSSRSIDYSLETNRPLRQVFDTVNGFHLANEWHPLRSKDPRIQFRLEGEPQGEGARLVYESRQPRLGTGSFEIVESEQDERVLIAAENSSYGENKRHEVTLRQRGRTVELRWGYTVDYGWNLFGRYAGLYIDRTVGDDVRASVGSLVGLLATMPNFDYKTLDEISTLEVEPVHVLFMSRKSERNITAVEEAMVGAIEGIRNAMRDNKLEAAGPLRLITTSFGAENYEFDVAVPVRFMEGVVPPVAEPVDPAAALVAAEPVFDEDGNVVEAPPPPPPPVIPLLPGLKLPEGVVHGVGYSGRAVMAPYAGHPAALPLVRDMLRAYAAANGKTIHDRAFEEYLTDIDNTAAEDAEFRVYWPVR